MSLVSDLVTEVVDSSSDLSQVLRKARVLASELRSPELREWVQAEQNGYKHNDVLPEYRIFTGLNFGNFVGLGRYAKGLPIAIATLPEKWREHYSKLELRSGVAALQELSEGEYREQWSADNIAAVTEDIYTGMNLISAWKSIPKTNVAAVIDSVRNRLLNFLLDLREQHPEVEDAGSNLRSIPNEHVRVIVVNNISGGHNVLASGETVHQEVQQGVKPGDLASLIAALTEAFLPEDLISELPSAIEQDEPVRTDGLGPSVSLWLAKVGEKVATNSIAGFAAQALLQFYGG